MNANDFLRKLQRIIYIGADISTGMIAQARGKLGEAILLRTTYLLVTDGEILQFDLDSFDATYSSDDSHHFPHPYLGLSELLQALKRRGRFALMRLNWQFLTNYWAAVANHFGRNILKVNRQSLKTRTSQLDIKKYKIRNLLYANPILKFSIIIYMSAQKHLEEGYNERKDV
jgi:SAM-dependent methyltransferase